MIVNIKTTYLPVIKFSFYGHDIEIPNTKNTDIFLC